MHFPPAHLYCWSIAFLTELTRAQTTASIAIADTKPVSGASQIISPSFAGFGIETSNLFSFTGFASTNKLSVNLLNNLANYTGTPPHIRIGGNTQDYILYNDSYTDYGIGTNPDPTGQGANPTDLLYIGPKFFDALSRFPSNTPITYGLSLAYIGSDYLDQITAMAKAVYSGISNLNLVSFEIGNEPDLYLSNAFRNGTWDGSVYTEQWLERAGAVYTEVLEPEGANSSFFETACTASTIGTSFELTDLVNDGITVTANSSSNPYVSSWNQHDYYYYIGVSTYALTMGGFMDLSTTPTQFASWVSQIQQGHTAGYPYALREMGVVGPIGYDGITNVFAASLWTLNFFLYAASLNISSVQMHMTDNSNASAWLPVEKYGLQPYVRPNYYAWAAFDQTIGCSCQARVAALNLSSTPTGYADHIGAYAVYQNEALASIVLLNTVIANISTSAKPTLTVSLTLPTSLAGQTLYLSYLTADGADAKNGTTWNGISYEQDTEGKPTLVNGTTTTVTIGSDGGVDVPLRDTQAVVANLGSVIGSDNDLAAACTTLAATTPDAKPASSTGLPVAVTTASGVTISTSSTSAKKSDASGGLESIWSTGGALALGAVILGFVQGMGLML